MIVIRRFASTSTAVLAAGAIVLGAHAALPSSDSGPANLSPANVTLASSMRVTDWTPAGATAVTAHPSGRIRCPHHVDKKTKKEKGCVLGSINDNKELNKNVKTVAKCTAKTVLKKRRKLTPGGARVSIVLCSIMDGGKVE